ncbi:MAG: SUMF1/EgtB/PvdO family nonheme iron enzyme, partial [Spirochaetales bacterium]|nr:SUMF1/EgtB/PvdO family nonheme iron enzyme [Spirochaetales bacterium]
SRTELCNREAYQVMKAYPNRDYFTDCKNAYPKIEVPNLSNQTMPVRYMPAMFYISFCNRLSELTGRTSCYTNVTDSIYVESSNIKNVNCRPNNNGFRLPSYVEWTYAANANKGYTYSGTNDINGKNGSLPYISTSIVTVRSVAANAWGLRGMSGNVAELCHYYHNASTEYSISTTSTFCMQHGIGSCTHSYPSETRNHTLLALGSRHPNYSLDRCYEVFGFMRRGLTGYGQADEYTCYYAGWSAHDDGTNNIINRYIGARIMYK